MPYLNAKISAPQSAETTNKIAAFLTEFTADVLGKKRELTSVAVEYVAANEWFIGGASVASGGLATFYLDIKITEGTNTKNQKADYVKKVFAAFESVLGNLDPASYIVIHEVRADSWGYEGATQEFRYIKGKVL
ncbi:MAG: tautomerase family protein [Pseudomonadota bacterium]